MKRNLLAGFTLIELMVVIAIIGTLSSIVLSSLTTARGKGNDAAIKQDLAEMPAAVELKRIESSDLGFVGNQSNRYEYTLACSTTPSTANDSGALFRDAASKTSSTLNSAVCSTNAEPIPPYPLSAGGLTLNSKYYIDASGNLAHVYGSAFPILNSISWWAASVKLSTGEYYCVDALDSPTTTPTLTISGNDYTC